MGRAFAKAKSKISLVAFSSCKVICDSGRRMVLAPRAMYSVTVVPDSNSSVSSSSGSFGLMYSEMLRPMIFVHALR